jgi:hypothetical protein
MPLTRRRERPVTELSDKQLERQVRDADRVLARLPDRAPDGREAARLLPVLERASQTRQAATDELARREHERTRAEQEERLAPLRRAQQRAARQAGRSVQLRALDEVAPLAYPEIAGMTLVATRLTVEEGENLLRLARRRIDGEEPLSEDEIATYETLVGRAAGDDDLFARRRTERHEEEKLAALQAAERRHPQAEDLVAAVMSDPVLFDGLHLRVRPDVVVIDEYGRESKGGTACRIFTPENVATLHLLLTMIVAAGATEIVVDEHGNLGDGLPRIDRSTITALRRNGYLDTKAEGVDLKIGLGPRTRRIAAKWSIQVPTTGDND